MKTNLTFECEHDHSQRTMTCSWLDGRVQLVYNFVVDKAFLLVDGLVKCSYNSLTVAEFSAQQVECQRVAESLV